MRMWFIYFGLSSLTSIDSKRKSWTEFDNKSLINFSDNRTYVSLIITQQQTYDWPYHNHGSELDRQLQARLLALSPVYNNCTTNQTTSLLMRPWKICILQYHYTVSDYGTVWQLRSSSRYNAATRLFQRSFRVSAISTTTLTAILFSVATVDCFSTYNSLKYV